MTAVVETLDAHPAAAVWPMLDEADLRRLAEDIREHGLVFPILLDGDGRIVDGRNRYAACRIAGVEPRFETYLGDPVVMVLSANNERRHLTTGQRAMATALTLAADGKRRNGRWARGSLPDSTESRNTWQAAMTQAGVVLDHAPELAADVVAGALALSAAHDQAEANRAATDRIAAVGPDLAALIESRVIDVAEAERRLAEVKRKAEDAKRIKKLDSDLAKRVRDGHLDVGEAEAVMAERAARIQAWADALADALRRIARMVGAPMPEGIPELLGDTRTRALVAVLECLEGEDLDVLRG